jgi:hypothetical protein
VLPERFGCFDEGGEPIAKELLTAAGRAVAADRLAHDVGTLSSAIDTTLTMGKALGRFCTRVEETIVAAPTGSDLDAVRELAVFAWWIAVASEHGGTPRELEFDHALALTQAVVQAGREELGDPPGRACWMSWAQEIIASASEVIEMASAPDRSPEGQLAFSARSLLTTCTQTLALFGSSLHLSLRVNSPSASVAGVSLGRMTTGHPRWSEFVARLYGREGCDFRESAAGSLVWSCSAHTRDRAAAILRDMGATDEDLLATFDHFDANGGYCDCEILLNVDGFLRDD